MIGIVAILVILGFGCAGQSTSFVDMDRYYVYAPQGLEQITKHGETYFVKKSQDYEITFTVFGYKDFLALPIEIRNKTGLDIEPQDYGIALYDGMDQLPIKMITHDELNGIEKKLLDVKGFNLASPSIQGAVSTVDSLINMPANSSLGGDIRSIIQNYFEFRPIYAKSARKGFIAFYHDFKLEYPLTLKITISGQDKYFYLAPASKEAD
jgi:hypothetical protein